MKSGGGGQGGLAQNFLGSEYNSSNWYHSEYDIIGV